MSISRCIFKLIFLEAVLVCSISYFNNKRWAGHGRDAAVAKIATMDANWSSDWQPPFYENDWRLRLSRLNGRHDFPVPCG